MNLILLDYIDPRQQQQQQQNEQHQEEPPKADPSASSSTTTTAGTKVQTTGRSTTSTEGRTSTVNDTNHTIVASQSSSSSSSSSFVLDYELPAHDVRTLHIVRHLKKQTGDRIRIGLYPHGPLGEAIVTILSSAPLSPAHNNKHNSTQTTVKLTIDPTTLQYNNPSISSSSCLLPSQQQQQRPQPLPMIRVLIGIPYPKVIKALWSVLATFGVQHIVYIRADWTDINYCDTSALTPAVYAPLLREGIAQGCCTTHPPLVTVLPKSMTVRQLLSNTATTVGDDNDHPFSFSEWTKNCCKIVLDIPDMEHDDEVVLGKSIRQCYLQQQSMKKEGIVLAIGPERGWTHTEAVAFRKAGFVTATLGNAILRTDTAVISAVTLARDILLEKKDTVPVSSSPTTPLSSSQQISSRPTSFPTTTTSSTATAMTDGDRTTTPPVQVLPTGQKRSHPETDS
jgi:16S rRNA U1498 N3-methylase RsmE